MNEEHDGKGSYDRDYYTEHFPLPDVSTTTSKALTAGTTVVTVSSTNGFPSSGSILIEDDKITYTGKTTTTFTGCTSVATHTISQSVYPYVVEISTTDSGTAPTYTPVQKDTDFYIDLETGRIHLYKDDYGSLSILDNTVPPRLIPDRFKVSYIWGNSTIPNDITRACLMIAAQDLTHTAVRKAVMDGNNNFTPNVIDVDKEQIDKIIGENTNVKSSNV